MIETHEIHNEAVESLDVTLEITPDPTGATPQFALSAKGVNTPGTFFNGTLGTWDSTTRRVTCRTPTIGGSGTLAITAGNSYSVWYRVTVSSETFVGICATIVCPG